MDISATNETWFNTSYIPFFFVAMLSVSISIGSKTFPQARLELPVDFSDNTRRQ